MGSIPDSHNIELKVHMCMLIYKCFISEKDHFLLKFFVTVDMLLSGNVVLISGTKSWAWGLIWQKKLGLGTHWAQEVGLGDPPIADKCIIWGAKAGIGVQMQRLGAQMQKFG